MNFIVIEFILFFWNGRIIYGFLLVVDNNYVISRVEQKGRAHCRTSVETFAIIHKFISSIYYYRQIRDRIDFKSARVLLWKYEFYESIPKDHPVVL